MQVLEDRPLGRLEAGTRFSQAVELRTQDVLEPKVSEQAVEAEKLLADEPAKAFDADRRFAGRPAPSLPPAVPGATDFGDAEGPEGEEDAPGLRPC